MTLMLLIDTNVWLDYFLDRSVLHEKARSIVIEASRREIVMACAVHSVKDCYFLLQMELKRMERRENGSVSEPAALAIREVAWSCAKCMRKLAYVVPSDDSDVIEAAIMRANHPDFEDNLIMAAAMRAQVDYVVTSDSALVDHFPKYCITLDSALQLIKPE